MAIKQSGQFVKRTVPVNVNNDESVRRGEKEMEICEVTCDACGHKSVGIIGPFGGVCGEDEKGPWASTNFYVRALDFSVYDFSPAGDAKETLYWYIADRDDAHACDECVDAGLVNVLERENLLVIPNEVLNLNPIDTDPIKNDPEDMN